MSNPALKALSSASISSVDVSAKLASSCRWLAELAGYPLLGTWVIRPPNDYD